MVVVAVQGPPDPECPLGDGQVVDSPHRPSRQPSGYSLGDRRDYLSKVEYALPQNSTALFLTSLFSDRRPVVSRP